MRRKCALAISLLLVFLTFLVADIKIQSIEAAETFKAGDWMKYEVTITPTIQGEINPTWVKFEFLSIKGTNATLEATMHLSDGTKKIETMIADIVNGSDTGLFIPPNAKTGDSIYISNQGNITMENETTLTCTGVERTVVYASSSNSTHDFSCYWDKQTGIMLEQYNTIEDITTIYSVEDTNMWQTQSSDYSLDPTVLTAILVVVAVVVALIFLRTRKKKPRRRIYRKRK